MKTYDFREFVRGEHKEKNKMPGLSLAPLAAAPFVPSVAYAEEESVQNKMMNAFDPLIDLAQAMAYPVAMLAVVGGSIFIMIGNKDKGFTLMQNAAMGYMLVVISPMILDVLVDAMDGVTQ